MDSVSKPSRKPLAFASPLLPQRARNARAHVSARVVRPFHQSRPQRPCFVDLTQLARLLPTCCESSQGPTTPEPEEASDATGTVPAPTFYVAAVTELVAALLGLALCNFSKVPVLGPNFTVTRDTVIHALSAAALFSAFFWILDKAPTGINEATERQFREIFDARSLPEVAFFCACVSLGEELLFRAWLLAALCALGVPQVSSLLISSLVFGAFHAYTALYIALASIAGGLLGAMFLTTGSTLEPLLVHFLYDFATISIMKARWKSK